MVGVALLTLPGRRADSRDSAQEAQIAGPVKVDTREYFDASVGAWPRGVAARSVCLPAHHVDLCAERPATAVHVSWHDCGGEGGRSV
mgnify:CR=1 FL=1